MYSDRRPILLANARIVDPSRDLDHQGDVLIADGVIRDTQRGIRAAGVPEGTEIIDCRGRLVAPGIGAHLMRTPVRGRPGLVWAAGMSGLTSNCDATVPNVCLWPFGGL